MDQQRGTALMGMFDDDRLEWRETYFVLFESAQRPLLRDVERALKDLHGRFQVQDGIADDLGKFESITVLSPEDHAALEITYLTGEDVREQGAALAKDCKSCGEVDPAKLARISKCDARLDVMHFEQMDLEPSDEPDDMLDPTTLLTVMEALARLTRGVGVDPQSGLLL
jgi:hypothetical protein